RLKQLDQRITIRTTLRPLVLSETSDYIHFRIVKAGKGSVLFEDRAIKAVYRFSGGIPRLVNLIASRAMMVAYINSSHKVDKEHVRDAVKHLSDVSPLKSTLRSPAFYVLSALLLLAMGAASVPLYEAHLQDRAIGRFLSRNAGLVVSRHDVQTVPKAQPGIDKNRQGSGSAVRMEAPSRGNESPGVLGRMDRAAVAKSSAALKNQKRKATVIVKWARLRQRPSLRAERISVASEGSVFDIVGDWTEINGNKWYKIAAPGGEYLWIAAHLVEVESRHQ
ncbi:MAG: SH3 domain-containing protein, partial [Acidobacteria bacterium]|nr:SH3 domain-containing protein [Acidobacteriota bacterium]